MKIRRSIFGLIVLGVVLIALLLWFGKRKSAETSSPDVTAATNATQRMAAASSLAASTPAYTNTPSPQVAVNTATPSMQDKGEQIKEGLAKLNDANMVFYGKVSDQFGHVVPDAAVNFGVRIYNSFESTVKYGETKSDANGLFTISGYRGESLGLGVKKTGYVFVSMEGSGIYSSMWPEEKRAHPDKNNPVVIKMWKLQGAEPLVEIGKEYRLPFTNSPILFDLVTGNIVPTGGDLEVIIKRASGLLSKKNPADWSIQLKSVTGGIVESDDATARVTYEAPTEGYQDSILTQMKQGNPAWYDNVDKVFFFKSRNGQVYGKLHFEFRVNNDPKGLMWFQFKGIANTNSSRNWEATAQQ